MTTPSTLVYGGPVLQQTITRQDDGAYVYHLRCTHGLWARCAVAAESLARAREQARMGERVAHIQRRLRAALEKIPQVACDCPHAPIVHVPAFDPSGVKLAIPTPSNLKVTDGPGPAPSY